MLHIDHPRQSLLLQLQEKRQRREGGGTADVEGGAHLKVHQVGAHGVVLLAWRTGVHREMGRIHSALLEELAEHVARGTVGLLEGDGFGHEHVELDGLFAVGFAWRVTLERLPW